MALYAHHGTNMPWRLFLCLQQQAATYTPLRGLPLHLLGGFHTPPWRLAQASVEASRILGCWVSMATSNQARGRVTQHMALARGACLRTQLHQTFSVLDSGHLYACCTTAWARLSAAQRTHSDRTTKRQKYDIEKTISYEFKIMYMI